MKSGARELSREIHARKKILCGIENLKFGRDLREGEEKIYDNPIRLIWSIFKLNFYSCWFKDFFLGGKILREVLSNFLNLNIQIFGFVLSLKKIIENLVFPLIQWIFQYVKSSAVKASEISETKIINFFLPCSSFEMKIQQNLLVEICWKELNLSINFYKLSPLPFAFENSQ